MVPPARGAISGPSGPQRLAAAPAVPSPAMSTIRSGAASTACLRVSKISCGRATLMFASRPNSARMAAAAAGASGPVWPEAGLASTSMRRIPLMAEETGLKSSNAGPVIRRQRPGAF